MKQTFAVIILVIILFFVFSLFLLPANNKILFYAKTNAPNSSVQRVLANKGYMKKWLPEAAKQLAENQFLLDDCTFTFASDNLQNSNINVKYGSISATSMVSVQPLKDSSMVYVGFVFRDSNNPFSKIANYNKYKHIENATRKIFNSIATFFEKNENVYGIKMSREILKDSTLIALKTTQKTYPTVNDIYKNIETLKIFCASNGALQTNPPMLNIYKDGDSGFTYMVALPINKWLNTSGEIIGKRMLAGGNILQSGDVKGGFYTVNNALKELENFRADIAAMSPAIPYQSLVTDRSKESDTSKWITKLYFPVF